MNARLSADKNLEIKVIIMLINVRRLLPTNFNSCR
jgi:hypothetical protein